MKQSLLCPRISMLFTVKIAFTVQADHVYNQGRSQGGFKGFGRTPFSELSFLNRDTG